VRLVHALLTKNQPYVMRHAAPESEELPESV